MLSIVESKKFKNEIDRILHLPGISLKGILEMSFVLDEALPQEVQKEMCQDLIGILKRHDPIFQNTRLNLVHWGSTISEENVSAPKIILGTCFTGNQEYEKLAAGTCPHAGYEELLAFLRLYQARSKIIILIAKEINTQETEESKKLLQPFLGRKMIRFYL